MRRQFRNTRVARGRLGQTVEYLIFTALFVAVVAVAVIAFRAISATGNRAFTAAPPDVATPLLSSSPLAAERGAELLPTPTVLAPSVAGAVVSPTLELYPTPVPVYTIVVTPLPPMTLSVDELRATEEAGRPTSPPVPTLDPGEPIHVQMDVTGEPSVEISTQDSSLILIGRVTQVLPARWTTPTGLRPENPTHPEEGAGIFRPVLIEVEEYLKGELPEQNLIVYAWGGQVGEDVFAWEPDDLQTFEEGERLVVFLKPQNGPTDGTHAGAQLWSPVERYTITPEGNAQNYYHSIPLDQLRNEIRRILSEVQNPIVP